MSDDHNAEFPPSPFAKYRGELMLGDSSVDCYVLDTRERVISLRASVKSIANIDASNLGDYIGAQALKSFINKDLILGELIDFHIPGTQLRSKGIAADKFLDICKAYVSALSAGVLSTERQREIAIRCSILLH